jgi:hypothetical protein
LRVLRTRNYLKFGAFSHMPEQLRKIFISNNDPQEPWANRMARMLGGDRAGCYSLLVRACELKELALLGQNNLPSPDSDRGKSGKSIYHF